MWALRAVAGTACLVILSACTETGTVGFDPNDPEVLAAIDSLMDQSIAAAGRVDPDGVLGAMGGGEDFTLITGDVMLTGLQRVRETFADTYDGLASQQQSVYESRIRLLTPDVALYTVVGEGVYTDKAGWTSEPVGLGLTVIFVRENGRWVGHHVHQSVAK